MPTIAAMGIEVADWPRATPPMKTTASRPSRRTVISGRRRSAYRPVWGGLDGVKGEGEGDVLLRFGRGCGSSRRHVGV